MGSNGFIADTWIRAKLKIRFDLDKLDEPRKIADRSNRRRSRRKEGDKEVEIIER